MAGQIVSICATCANEFVRSGSKSGKFCSIDCYRKSQRSGDYKRGPGPLRTRRPCTNCGKMTVRNPATDRHGNKCDKVFCSRACYDQHRSAAIKAREVNCAHCGVAFSPGSGNGFKYCSHKCRVEHKRPKPINCINCGCEFCAVKRMKRKDDRIEFVSISNAKTCSLECEIAWISNNEERKKKIGDAFRGPNHPNWQGGKSSLNNVSGRGAGWENIRKKALERDGHRCVDCGISNDQCIEKFGRGLDVDHVVPFHNFSKFKEANRLSNLQCRCSSCHKRAEAKRKNVQMVLPFQDSEKRRHKGGHRRGEKHPKAKLTSVQVLQIRKDHADGVLARDLAKAYGIEKSSVHAIIKGKTWKCLPISPSKKQN